MPRPTRLTRYTSHPLRYSRRTNLFSSGLLVHCIFSTSHSILPPMPAYWARCPVRAIAVSGPAASMKLETGVPPVRMQA